MKAWLVVVGILVLLLGVPFRKYETEKLLPILCLQAQREGTVIHILSEAGEGYGKTWKEAVKDLGDRACGEVFFDTAEQAVFSDRDLAVEAAQSGDLRPAAEVFFRTGFEDPGTLHAYYSSHGSDLKIGDLTQREWEE